MKAVGQIEEGRDRLGRLEEELVRKRGEREKRHEIGNRRQKEVRGR